MKTLVVVNTMSGNSNKINIDEIIKSFASKDDVYIKKLKKENDDYSIKGFEKIIVCGGDGTIFNAMEKARNEKVIILYFPYGTLNERAQVNKNGKNLVKLNQMAESNEKPFAYVYAAGTFTEIAYKTKNKNKKKIKGLAYVLNVLKAYRVNNIEARIEAKGLNEESKYTLIMVLDSNQCFRFRFNRAYRFDETSLFLLTIKSPGKDNLINRIKIFFPFFRVFFIGFSKDYKSKNITFTKTTTVNLMLKDTTVFCVDGERREESGQILIRKNNLLPRVFIGRIKKRYFKSNKTTSTKTIN